MFAMEPPLLQQHGLLSIAADTSNNNNNDSPTTTAIRVPWRSGGGDFWTTTPPLKQRHQKRSNPRRYSSAGPPPEEVFASYAANFEFLSTWNVTEDGGGGELATATEMTDDQLRSLGFPVPPPVSVAPPLRGGTGGRSHGPVVDNPFIHFVSRKYIFIDRLFL